jgi:hypothetical protein
VVSNIQKKRHRECRDIVRKRSARAEQSSDGRVERECSELRRGARVCEGA